ncbi:hypothetical protein [Dysgonomonas capnocytophagoides]|uniref:hypothetical protein n=1 Tax=Dysgonomonas capnocytophagoides TaxID=45254 RepID=UPI0003F7576F|nr:hypothetical protein [Dysgonomonas capnocytophagoides]
MDLLLQHIHQETGIAQFIETTASKYNLPEETLHKFTDVVISSLLGAVLLQGDTPETEKLLSSYYSKISEEDIEPAKRTDLTIGILNKIFNNKLTEFYSILSEYNNIELKNVDDMTIILSELFIKQIPRFMASEKYSINGLLGHLLGERDYFIDQIPDAVIDLLNISSKHNIGQNISADAVVVSNAVRYTLLREKRESEEANRKKSWFEKIFKKG